MTESIPNPLTHNPKAYVKRRRHKPIEPVTAEQKQAVTDRLVNGETLTEITSDPATPSLIALKRAAKTDPAFAAVLAEALSDFADAAITDAVEFAGHMLESGDEKAVSMAHKYMMTLTAGLEKLTPKTHGTLLKLAGSDGGALTVNVIKYAEPTLNKHEHHDAKAHEEDQVS